MVLFKRQENPRKQVRASAFWTESGNPGKAPNPKAEPLCELRGNFSPRMRVLCFGGLDSEKGAFSQQILIVPSVNKYLLSAYSPRP